MKTENQRLLERFAREASSRVGVRRAAPAVLVVVAAAVACAAYGNDAVTTRPTGTPSRVSADTVATIKSFDIQPSTSIVVGQEFSVSSTVTNPCATGRHLAVTLEQIGFGFDSASVAIADFDETSACSDVVNSKTWRFNSPGVRTYRLHVLEAGGDLTNGKNEITRELVVSVNAA